MISRITLAADSTGGKSPSSLLNQKELRWLWWIWIDKTHFLMWRSKSQPHICFRIIECHCNSRALTYFDHHFSLLTREWVCFEVILTIGCQCTISRILRWRLCVKMYQIYSSIDDDICEENVTFDNRFFGGWVQVCQSICFRHTYSNNIWLIWNQKPYICGSSISTKHDSSIILDSNDSSLKTGED